MRRTRRVWFGGAVKKSACERKVDSASRAHCPLSAFQHDLDPVGKYWSFGVITDVDVAYPLGPSPATDRLFPSTTTVAPPPPPWLSRSRFAVLYHSPSYLSFWPVSGYRPIKRLTASSTYIPSSVPSNHTTLRHYFLMAPTPLGDTGRGTRTISLIATSGRLESVMIRPRN